MQYIIAALYILLSCSGLVLFKLGSQTGISLGVSSGIFSFKISLISIFGMLCYISSFLIYLVLVSKFDLSKIYPITTGIIFIGVMVASVLFLHESVSWVQILASGLILIGVVLLSLKR
ncbi:MULTISPECIES: hypothetical protein [Clostridiaceae]|uniref:4-amino-4-deoxy-L-arabinose-phosphoundecaprenol flippase subunit ArnF n=1 Tax=Clostridium facile TaxID=2763035 RepID=A0ABR7IP32_9CLOT|nr:MULTISPECIES: hypothetical protein [Clostridiaceae]MBC5786872.1 hypothetical protein [Clostridium facile]